MSIKDSNVSTSGTDGSSDLWFPFRDKKIPVTHPLSVTRDVATKALDSEIFRNWYRQCETTRDKKAIDIRSVEFQSIDMFGSRRVGFIKMKADCRLVDGETKHEHPLPGICFLRGDSVGILVALVCKEEKQVYSLLVEQPRIPVGQVSCLELPAGMIDSVADGILGTAAKEIMEEECDIKVRASELIDLTELAYGTTHRGIAPSAGGCDEHIRYLYLERHVSSKQISEMKGKLSGLREHGEFITLRVVCFDELWRCGDSKALCALFLLDKLRTDGKLKLGPMGENEQKLEASFEPGLQTSQGIRIPQLAFGLYKVPANDDGEKIISNAIAAGYRHFDCASFYGNERVLGNALRKSGLPRHAFCLCSKVWNDAQKEGREVVRKALDKSLAELDFGGYWDIFYIHWPVPGFFIETYKELQEAQREGKIRSIGLSNFGINEYEALVNDSAVVTPPVVNQMEVSPFMYRPKVIEYFQSHNIVVAASKALHRTEGMMDGIIADMARQHRVSPAQIMLRWGCQKKLVVVAKTSRLQRMQENRDIDGFVLNNSEMQLLDSLTSEEDITKREALEVERRKGM